MRTIRYCWEKYDLNAEVLYVHRLEDAILSNAEFSTSWSLNQHSGLVAAVFATVVQILPARPTYHIQVSEFESFRLQHTGACQWLPLTSEVVESMPFTWEATTEVWLLGSIWPSISCWEHLGKWTVGDRSLCICLSFSASLFPAN